MKDTKKSLHTATFRRSVLATCLMLAFGTVGAQDSGQRADEMRKDIYTLDSKLSVGIGFVSSDNREFGKYRGLTDQGTYGLLDLDLVTRDENDGTWFKVRGKNTGLNNRELRLEHEQQGRWSYFLEGSQSNRVEPFVVKTGLQGIGTGSQIVSSTAPKRDLDLQTQHDIYSLGVRKFSSGGFDVRMTARQDTKRGDRLFGRGMAAATSLMEFLTEPMDQVTRQWDITANYADRKLQMSGGYSGSSFDTNIPVLFVAGGASGFAGGPSQATNPAMNAFGLPPSNHASRVHLSGGYNWDNTTRSTFKIARTVAEQNELFSPAYTVRLANTPASLNGKVLTTLGFADLSMRPADKLDVVANVRYEDRDDQTPELQYIASTGASTSSAGITGFNKPRMLRQLKGSLEAGYQLDDGYRLVGSLEQENAKRNGSRDKIRIAYREENNETTQRLEIKRSMSETLNGGIALMHSARTGTDWVRDTYIKPELSNRLAAMLFADRVRDKLRVTGDWSPTELWSLQMVADFSHDTYSDTDRQLGARKGKAHLFSADAVYRINDKWNFTLWAAQDDTLAQQATGETVVWDADLRNASTAWGMGLKGKPRTNLELGLDFSSSLNSAESLLNKISGAANVSVNSLPSYYYSQKTLKLFADYALSTYSAVRLDLIIDRRENNDWTWLGWAYSDGTTVTNVPNGNADFIGVSYRYRWR
jgi:MtrB/PioB family decaheme-associated outer membrane protein